RGLLRRNGSHRTQYNRRYQQPKTHGPIKVFLPRGRTCHRLSHTFLALFRLVGSSIGAALRACLLLVPYRRELTRELPLGPFDATIVGAAAPPRHVRLTGYVDARADGANYRRRWRVAVRRRHNDQKLQEFLLPYEVVRKSTEPEQTLMVFLESTYR